MVVPAYLALSQIGDAIFEKHGGKRPPDWKVGRVITALEQSGQLTVERVSKYRTIRASDIAVVAAELHRTGWLPTFVENQQAEVAVA